MNATEWVGLAALVASFVAAIYAGLTFHHPRAPKRPSPPRFHGQLPGDGASLSEFLWKHDGQVVDLDVGFTWVMDGEADPDVDFIQATRGEANDWSHALVLSTGPREEGEVTQILRYNILELPRQHMSAFAADPAGGRYASLRGAFIPRSKGAAKLYSYGLLVQVDEWNRALWDR
ncbi:hypothetical protein G3576_07880 [Roseomonas stagni]|uniref:Uncharacterized protein n=1 Tax=Falsiroseomonas algicola TaxID=2716930 RepID=A0A6M1LI49_9PROT|nr:hypothetical protein [Falsiroseomonas algicola]NGM19931.1 hypothetical protein [Falsiroseomonas algicola]